MSLASDSLRLLGTFRLRVHGQEVALGQPRLEELVALIAIQRGEPMPRVQIAYRIWPASSEKQARVNVRNTLLQLRRNLPDADVVASVRSAAKRSDCTSNCKLTVLRISQTLL